MKSVAGDPASKEKGRVIKREEEKQETDFPGYRGQRTENAAGGSRAVRMGSQEGDRDTEEERREEVQIIRDRRFGRLRANRRMGNRFPRVRRIGEHPQ